MCSMLGSDVVDRRSESAGAVAALDDDRDDCWLQWLTVRKAVVACGMESRSAIGREAIVGSEGMAVEVRA